MARRRHVAITAALMGLVPVGPAALGAYLLAAGEAPPITLAAASSPAVVDEVPIGRPGFAGVLLTSGSVVVDWQRVSLPIDNGRYAYLGGETVSVSADGMGALRLDDGSVIVMCPASKMRLTLGDAGDLQLDLLAGSARFLFSGKRPFAVNAGAAVVSAGTLASEPIVGEVDVADGGAVICALRGDVAVGATRHDEVRARAGEMVSVTTKQGAADVTVTSRPVPARFSAAAGAGAGDLVSGAAPFLCRCREIERFADAADMAPGQGPLQVPAVSPEVPAGLPSILPPPAATAALATPGPPDPFDPNVLPPPAAGPATPPLVVPAPLVPSGGTGGGGTSSRS